MKIDFFLRLRREKQNRKMILGSLLIILTFSKWSHSVPIPLAPSDRSTECSGHGRVVDGKCECEDTFLVRFFFVLFFQKKTTARYKIRLEKCYFLENSAHMESVCWPIKGTERTRSSSSTARAGGAITFISPSLVLVLISLKAG